MGLLVAKIVSLLSFSFGINDRVNYKNLTIFTHVVAAITSSVDCITFAIIEMSTAY